MGIKTVTIENKNNGIQTIRILEAMRIDDDKAYLEKIGNSLVIIPFNNPWPNMIDSLDEFTLDFMDDRAQPKIQQREFNRIPDLKVENWVK